MKKMLALGLLLLAFDTFATLSYYPPETIEKFLDPDTSSLELSNEIFNLSHNQKSDMTYSEARRIMFGELFIEAKSNGKYLLKEAYCNITVDESAGVGPNKIPNSKYVNCEHTWPQSKFSKKFPSEMQKTDLHHLFPTDMRANSTRNNFPFGNVNGQSTHSNCHDSKIGNAIGTNIRSFEPPTEHKGNVARAIYYFSTRYKMNIEESEAKFLKIWNEEDPVDEAERQRNDKIMQLQGNRNPFIDYPGLIGRL